MSLRPSLDFLLHDWLDVTALTARPRFADHSRDTFDAVLETCERIARDKYAPFNRLVDTEEPRIEGDKVILPRATQEAHDAYAASGMLGATQDYEIGGMQLPHTVAAAANGFFAMASISISAALLTTGNANLLMAHGSARQREVFARAEYAGRWSGTMCLSEPQAGSSLSDITTRATPDGDDYEADPLGPRYRLTGNKMWISAGDHELTENIVHVVLAKIPDNEGRLVAGTRGISIFIVPKWLVDEAGRLTGQRNDVALAGLNHKLGWRGTTNTLLNFGEGRYPVASGRGGHGGCGGRSDEGREGRGPGADEADGPCAGAIGYRVGEVGQGLAIMFHMMNEARIAIGTAATMLGLAGYYASRDYARQRLQGRPLAGGAAARDPKRPQEPILAHADVRRMLLAQKAFCEGALALQLYCARLVDEGKTGETGAAADARLLLEVLTPVAKSYPSEWCLEANSLAIQIHGGYGYTRDFPVEQYWRDNRLNMIHEGTHGIQALDLLGRKVLLEDGRGLAVLGARIAATVERARAGATEPPSPSQPQSQPQSPPQSHRQSQSPLADLAEILDGAWQRLLTATRMAWDQAPAEVALANAVPYLQAFGQVVIAWLWLDVATRALAVDPQRTQAATAGRLAAARYFFGYELPKIDPWLAVVARRDLICVDVPDDAF